MTRLLKIVLFSSLFLLHLSMVMAQGRPFSSGEKLHYKAIYNWGFFWIEAGEVDFSVTSETTLGNPRYIFKSSGQSLPNYDWIYRVRDRFESVVDSATLRPYSFTKESNEGNFRIWNSYSFNYETNKLMVQSETSTRRRQSDTLALNNYVFDVLTGVYYARCLDYSHYSYGQKIYINIAIDNKIYTLYGRFLGKEMLTLHDGRTFHTLKFSVLLVEGTIFKGGEDLVVWISDDRNKIPIMVEASILVGKVKAVLETAHGLKYPMSSFVEPISKP
ncbi:MAG TPA: DUF3108 domain-containing protein [Williamwhitmania sp.]|nr:DUF3108 domain-containing protein [Williamwhitmania sp.]